MSTCRLVHLAAVLLVVAGSAGIAHAATPSASAIATGSCSLPAFLQAPAPSQTSSNVCGCGDSVCIGKVNLGSCGPHRVCLATSTCASATQSYCVCVTQDPLPH